MANTARRRGKPCYIVFGMQDKRGYMDNGILYQSTHQINTYGDNECPCGKRPCLDILKCDHCMYINISIFFAFMSFY